jgi:hypothetical protein
LAFVQFCYKTYEQESVGVIICVLVSYIYIYKNCNTLSYGEQIYKSTQRLLSGFEKGDHNLILDNSYYTTEM